MLGICERKRSSGPKQGQVGRDWPERGRHYATETRQKIQVKRHLIWGACLDRICVATEALGVPPQYLLLRVRKQRGALV